MALYDGLCTASVTYTSAIIVPTVTLAGTTRSYSKPDAYEFITGQEITATITMPGGIVSPAGVTAASSGGGGGGGGGTGNGLTIDPASYQWSFDGDAVDPFKNFIYGSVGQRVALATADYQQAPFNFYTNASGNTEVDCNFNCVLSNPKTSKFAGGSAAFKAVSTQIGSVRPDFVKWDVYDGTVALMPNAIQFAGNANSTNGQQWANVTYKLAAEFGQVGQGCFCQLINADRDLYRTLTAQGAAHGALTHFVKSPYNAQQTLDMSLPYLYNGQWSLPTLGAGADSPTQPLSWNPDPYTYRWYESTANDSFETWTMFMPPACGGQPTAWIPMAHYTWKWQGTANWDVVNGWVLSGASGGQDAPPRGDTDFPAWNMVSPSPFSFVGAP